MLLLPQQQYFLNSRPGYGSCEKNISPRALWPLDMKLGTTELTEMCSSPIREKGTNRGAFWSAVLGESECRQQLISSVLGS